MKPKFLLLMLIPLLHGMFTTKETLNNHATNMMDMSILFFSTRGNAW